MKKTTLVIALVLVILFGSISSVSALPINCFGCGEPGNYSLIYATYRYQLTGYTPCFRDDHLDSIYHLWKYRCHVCDYCGYEYTKYYYETNVTLCPGEPIPDLVVLPYEL